MSHFLRGVRSGWFADAFRVSGPSIMLSDGGDDEAQSSRCQHVR